MTNQCMCKLYNKRPGLRRADNIIRQMSPLIIVRKEDCEITFEFRSFLLLKFPFDVCLRHFRHAFSMILRYEKKNDLFIESVDVKHHVIPDDM